MIKKPCRREVAGFFLRSREPRVMNTPWNPTRDSLESGRNVLCTRIQYARFDASEPMTKGSF